MGEKMKLVKVSLMAVLCSLLILLMPYSSAIDNSGIDRFEEDNFSMKINEAINNNNNTSYIRLMLKFIRITIVTIIALRITDRVFQGNGSIGEFVKGFINFVYVIRTNLLINRIKELDVVILPIG
jgi:hypothetical protein